MATTSTSNALLWLRASVLAIVGLAPFIGVAWVWAAIAYDEPTGATKQQWWTWVLWTIVVAWSVFGLDILLDGSRSARVRLGWLGGVVFGWPLGLPLYVSELVDPTPWAPPGTSRLLEKEKLEHAVEYLTACDVPARRIGPPGYRLAWGLGYVVPPPVFVSVRQRLRIEALTMAAVLTLFGSLYFVVRSSSFLELYEAWDRWLLTVAVVLMVPVASAGIGLLATLVLTPVLHRIARRLDLPRWHEFEP